MRGLVLALICALPLSACGPVSRDQAEANWLGYVEAETMYVAAPVSGRLAERLSTTERTHEIQRQMLDAASRRPADRDALAQRMRGGEF